MPSSKNSIGMYLVSGPPFPAIASLDSNWCLQAKSVIQLALRAESGIPTRKRRSV
jgi:hypothetical protein